MVISYLHKLGRCFKRETICWFGKLYCYIPGCSLLAGTWPYIDLFSYCRNSGKCSSIFPCIPSDQRNKGQNFFRAGFFVPNLIGGIVLGYVWKFVFNRAFVALGKISFCRSTFHLLAGYHKRCYGLLDHSICMAVCRIYDADLCSWIHERIQEPYGSCTD